LATHPTESTGKSTTAAALNEYQQNEKDRRGNEQEAKSKANKHKHCE
jgi:hypothetical protein